MDTSFLSLPWTILTLQRKQDLIKRNHLITSLKLTGGSGEQALKLRERKRRTMEMQRYGKREEGGFLLEAKRADRPIKNWPLLAPVTSPGKPLAHSHTCYNCLYRPEAGKRERERENVKRKYMHVLFHTTVHLQTKNGGGLDTFLNNKM